MATRTRNAPLATAVVCAAALLLGACGSSYKGLSKADYVSTADATCKTYENRLETLFRHVGSNPTLIEVKGVYGSQIVPVFRKEVVALRAIKAPKDDRDAVKKIYDDLSTGVDQLGAAVTASKSLDALQKISPSGLKRAQAGAQAYGLKVCGQS